MEQNTYVIALGGSLISPDFGKLNTTYLKTFRDFILGRVDDFNDRFVIIAGGGKTARKYQDALQKILGNPGNSQLDWMGVNSTKLNAQLIKEILSPYAHPRIHSNLDKTEYPEFKNILVAGGWKPGWSTDYCAVSHAIEAKANHVINLSNIDGVYDKDPNKFEDAIKFDRISWIKYRGLIPADWTPGMSAPFDPKASELAQMKNLKALMVKSDSKLLNLEAALNGQNFEGTVIY